MKKLIWKMGILFKAIKILKNWPVFVLIYFRIIKKPSVFFKTRDGCILKIRNVPKSTDIHVFTQIWLENVYLKNFNINENATVIDIGSHIGLFSIYVAQKLKNCKIFCFEPNLENYNVLMENIEINSIKNISTFNNAVSSKSGIIKFYNSQKDFAANSMYEKVGEEIQVQSITLENIIEKNKIKKCNLLKMDCEGAEYDILMNIPEKILEKIDNITLETKGKGEFEYTSDDLILKLKSSGFLINTKKLEDDLFLYSTKN